MGQVEGMEYADPHTTTTTARGQQCFIILCEFIQKWKSAYRSVLSYYENHDIAIAMSPSHADPVLPWLGVFKCLYQSHCTGWVYLNI